MGVFSSPPEVSDLYLNISKYKVSKYTILDPIWIPAALLGVGSLRGFPLSFLQQQQVSAQFLVDCSLSLSQEQKSFVSTFLSEAILVHIREDLLLLPGQAFSSQERRVQESRFVPAALRPPPDSSQSPFMPKPLRGTLQLSSPPQIFLLRNQPRSLEKKFRVNVNSLCVCCPVSPMRSFQLMAFLLCQFGKGTVILSVI